MNSIKILIIFIFILISLCLIFTLCDYNKEINKKTNIILEIGFIGVFLYLKLLYDKIR